MVLLFLHTFLSNQSFLPKSTFWGSWDFGKKVQKGPTCPTQICSQGGGSIPVFFCLGYQRVFWVPLGGSDGYSPVGLHTDLSTTRSQVRIPPPAGGRGEINHNKSERSIINQWMNWLKPWTKSKNVKKGPKRSSGLNTYFFLKGVGKFWRWWVNSEGGGWILKVVGKFWKWWVNYEGGG